MRSPRAHWKPQLLTLLDRVCRALLAVWALAALELFTVGLVAHREFASIWELENGAFWLAPSAFGVHERLRPARCAGLAAALWKGDRPIQRIALTALFGLFGAGVGWGVGGGRLLSALEQRAGFSGLVALVLGGTVYAAAPYFAKLRAPRPAHGSARDGGRDRAAGARQPLDFAAALPGVSRRPRRERAAACAERRARTVRRGATRQALALGARDRDAAAAGRGVVPDPTVRRPALALRQLSLRC